VAAALQKQVQRDFAPIWNVQATVSPFAHLADVPVGTWPVIIVASLPDPSVGGFHTTQFGQPLALVRFGNGWPLTASHETLELLADPSGNRVTPGDSPQEDGGRVEFVVEVCDPCEAPQFGYKVNGIALSDFYTPHYFDPVQAPGVRYDITGAITEPRQVLRGGYLSWVDPESQEVFQERFFSGSEPEIVNLSEVNQMPGSLRERIDRLTNADREKMIQEWAGTQEGQAASDVGGMYAKSRDAQARSWQARLDKLLAPKKS
jgi:hypothetical protein